MTQHRSHGMYAMCIDDDLSTRVLGGPFADIDDVLDKCFDEMMRADREATAMFYVDANSSRITVREIPREAFPTDLASWV